MVKEGWVGLQGNAWRAAHGEAGARTHGVSMSASSRKVMFRVVPFFPQRRTSVKRVLSFVARSGPGGRMVRGIKPSAKSSASTLEKIPL